jgi:hypothetical protein
MKEQSTTNELNPASVNAGLRHFKCLIASPSDTAPEREACERVVDDLNKSLGLSLGVFLETRMWENDTRPAFGEYPQAVINDQLGNDYIIFVGIMHQRFGTQTAAAGSGTEEEFNRALERLDRGEKVELMLYFNDAPIAVHAIDTTEIDKVKAFRKRVATLGSLYQGYSGVAEFEAKLRQHLTKLIVVLSGVNDRGSNGGVELSNHSSVQEALEKRLNEALVSFSGQPVIWVDPVLSRTNDISPNPSTNYGKRVQLEELIPSPKSTLVKAPPQFGLTCLAHRLVLDAWKLGAKWVYIDSKETKAHHMHKAAQLAASEFGWSVGDVTCIVLDAWNFFDQGAMKKLKTLCATHPDTPIIVMNTIDDSKFQTAQKEDENIDREFSSLHLLALPKAQLRKVVAEYNKAKEIGDEEVVLAKVTSDLHSLNIHRTPLNCITLLRVAEKHFDESPVNRTKMLEMVLFALFNMDGVPTYASRLDLKDCEYVLGRHCESMVRLGLYSFSKEHFIASLKQYGQEKLIDLDIEKLFEVLMANHILVREDAGFIFRASYWVSYFAAHRMHLDPDFRAYIFESNKYTSMPEVIEFYTGVDRNREDALKILCLDLRTTRETVSAKVRLPDGMNPYNDIRWLPTEEQLAAIQEGISQDVLSSGLPEELKDQHADASYNQIRPYNQSIEAFFEEYSVRNLVQCIRASSRALRNSDYVAPELKREMLEEILKGWQEISKVLLTLTPVLATHGFAAYEGYSWRLGEGFGNTLEEKVSRIIQVLPTNVVGFYREDLFSGKIGPLLFDRLKSEDNALRKHELALLIVFSRPREWKRHIDEYISSVDKNSFYLADIVTALRVRFQYDHLVDEEARDISYLVKLGLAKHKFGGRRPGLDKIRLISDTNLPKREQEE